MRVSATVTDGRGGTAAKFVDIEVVAKPEFKFDDILFDLDKYNLKADAIRILDQVVKVLQENPDLTVQIEGHTDSRATDEYNMKLGERRAKAAFDYLVKQKIAASRLSTVTYGESRPKVDNTAPEETRRLNRRAVLVVRVR